MSASPEQDTLATNLEGSVGAADLLSLIKFLAALRSEGSLTLSIGQLTGSMFFQDGCPVGAVLGAEHGWPALEGLVLAPGKRRFVFSHATCEPEHNLSLDADVLQRELDQLAQEGTRLAAVIGSLSAVPRRVAEDRDGDEPITLDRGAVKLLASVDGRQSVSDLLRLGSVAATLRHLARLVELGLINIEQPRSMMEDARVGVPNSTTLPARVDLLRLVINGALPGVRALLGQALRRLLELKLRRRVPEIIQLSAVECGLACLAMLLGYYGRMTTVSELRTQHEVSRDGLSALGIVRLARRYGMRVRAIALEQNDFRFVPLPAIVHWEFNHFLVVERWGRKRVDVVDPARGRCRLTADQFDRGFTGVVITLEPGVGFDRRSAPSGPSFRSYLFQYAQRVPVTFLQVLAASILILLIGLSLPLLTKVIVDEIIPLGMSDVMPVLGIGIVALFLSQTVATLLREWLLVYLRARIDLQMTLSFVEHLLGLPYSFFQQRTTGDLLTRLASNAILRDILSNQVLSTFLDSTLVVFYLIILVWQSPPFGLLTLVIGLVQVALLLLTNGPIRSLAGRELTAFGKSQGYLAEVLTAIATVKASGVEQSAFGRWSNFFFEQVNSSLHHNYVSVTVTTILMALRSFAALALLWVGAAQVLNGSMSIGSMVALSALAAEFFVPLASLVSSGQQLQLVAAHLDRIGDVTVAKREQQGQAVKTPGHLTGEISLRHVSFRYALDAPEVLHELNVAIESGQTVAIVGASGSGKSTLGRLLIGLHVPTRGDILYDRTPLHQLDYQEVRRQFGVVLQDTILFSGSILSNITLTQPSISKEVVVWAAQMAGIHEEIMAMPMGYDTFVAEGGSALSGGQRQRLAIARAIVRKPAILLLDEATSHLDVATEQRVAQNLKQLACTQIVIAHRLSTIRDAELILVLDRGVIVERGCHADLVARNGPYAQLIAGQVERNGVHGGQNGPAQRHLADYEDGAGPGGGGLTRSSAGRQASPG